MNTGDGSMLVYTRYSLVVVFQFLCGRGTIDGGDVTNATLISPACNV